MAASPPTLISSPITPAVCPDPLPPPPPPAFPQAAVTVRTTTPRATMRRRTRNPPSLDRLYRWGWSPERQSSKSPDRAAVPYDAVAPGDAGGTSQHPEQFRLLRVIVVDNDP